MKHTLKYLNKLKEQGAKRVKIENVLILLGSDKNRSEQLPTYDVKELQELVENFKKGDVKIEALLQMIWDRSYVEGMLYERYNNK